MIYLVNDRSLVTEVTNQTCPFHKQQPNVAYAGCTCTSVFTQRKRTPQEKEEHRTHRIGAGNCNAPHT